jgi:16S rRNA (adenine1518-N6/adenine1519-N6)-dimethyltransferase
MAVLIYQKEFADRMVAKPGSKDYSRLSVGTYYRTYCKLLETIPKTLFQPQPKVDSCMIQLIPRSSPPFYVANEPFYFDMVNKLFSHRRKKIETTLRKTYGKLNEEIPYLNKRVEELTPEQLGELSNILFEL